MKVTAIKDKVVLVEIDDPVKLAMTFLRFQEFYENPKFKGKIFTLGQFRDWYSRKHGGFTYAQDWAGFNMPSSALIPFIRGQFDPLTPDETTLLDLFKHRSDQFYIIGVSSGEAKEDALEHELTHAQFYLNEPYRQEVTEYITQHRAKFGKIFEYVAKHYHPDVHLDEVNAYVACNYDWLVEKGIAPPSKHHEYLVELRLFVTVLGG